MEYSTNDIIQDIDVRDLSISIVLGFVPTVVLFVLLAISIGEWVKVLSVLGWIFFTWSIYGIERVTGKVSTVLFWLAVQAFLSPVAMFAFLITTENTGPDYIAWVGSAIFLVVTVILGWTVGIAFYLISKRFENKSK